MGNIYFSYDKAVNAQKHMFRLKQRLKAIKQGKFISSDNKAPLGHGLYCI
jgi:hypothetical protein